jgi:hypothetical protein
MKPVDRSEILDYVTYNEQRATLRPAALEAKANRRILVGDCLAFLFENRDTVRYQVQEMMRTERMVKEADIQHELRTYNELLGDSGELGCTLLIGLEDEAERNVKLRQWKGLPEHLYVKLADGTKIRATFDPRQVGDERLSSVQYLKFQVGPKAPVAVGSDLDTLTVEAELTEAQRNALQTDLDG